MAVCEDCPLREVCEIPESFEDSLEAVCKNKGPLDLSPFPPSILLKNLPPGEDLAYNGVICSNEAVIKFVMAHTLLVYISEADNLGNNES